MAKLDVQYVRYPTDGSAARQFLPVFPKKRSEAVVQPRRHTRTRVYVDPVAILGIAVAACMLIMMVVGVFQFQAAQQRALEMERYVSQLSAQNKALENQYATGYDLEEIEQTALVLGMVPREETQQIAVAVTVPQTEEPTAPWYHFSTFLTGLFA